MAIKLTIAECYRILELEPGCSLEEIKSTWRLLSQIWHPDKHVAGSKAQELALKKQQSLNQAYAQLSELICDGKGGKQASERPQQSQASSGASRAQSEYSRASADGDSSKRRAPNSSEKGSLDLARFLATSFNNQAPKSMLPDELAHWSEKAKQGEPEGQYYMGISCEFGLGGNKIDYNNAAFWYERAAGKGNTQALYRLAYLYLYGHGVNANSSKGIRYLKDAANKGNTQAQLDLGMAYENGAWVAADLNEARKWYAMAAERGNQVAKRKLTELSGKS